MPKKKTVSHSKSETLTTESSMPAEKTHLHSKSESAHQEPAMTTENKHSHSRTSHATEKESSMNTKEQHSHSAPSRHASSDTERGKWGPPQSRGGRGGSADVLMSRGSCGVFSLPMPRFHRDARKVPL